MPTNLTPGQMKEFVRQHFEDFVNKRNAAVILKNMTADFYDHDGPGGKPTDASGDEQMMVGMYKAMPDLRLTIEEMLAEGDKRTFGWDVWNAPISGARNESEMLARRAAIPLKRLPDG